MSNKKLQAENSGINFKGVYTFTLRNAVTNEIEHVETVDNLVPTGALALIATLLGSSTGANAGKISHCAVGSNTTAPANGDIKLGTETYRNAIASLTSTGAVVYATGFFSASEAIGTHREAGIFINGSGTVDSGTLLSHVAINLTKTGTQTLTLDWTLTLTN